MSTATVYEARRTRATRAEMEERAEALITLASANGPCSVRHLFYAATVAKVPGITMNSGPTAARTLRTTSKGKRMRFS